MGKDIGTRPVFISYLNDDNKTISGYVILIEQNTNYIKFKTGSNVISIPYARLLKLKEVSNEDKDN